MIRPAAPSRPAPSWPAPSWLALFWLALTMLAAPAFARDVEVGTYVTSLSDVNLEDGSFRVGFYIWFNDPEGRFDITRDIDFDARSVTLGAPETETVPGGGSYTYARVSAVASHNFDLGSFPFDRQRLTLRMEATDPDGLVLVPDRDGTGAARDLGLRGWGIEGVSLSAGENVYDTDFGYWRPGDSGYSQLLLALDIARIRSPVLVDDFIGFTFAILITALTFFVPCSELGLRIGMNTGALFAAVTNLNRLHDAVGFRPEFAMIDVLAFLIFGALIASLAISIATNRMSKGDLARANLIDNRLGAGLMALALVLILLTLQAALA